MPPTASDLDMRADRALDFLLSTFKATGFQGSAAYKSAVWRVHRKGWAAAYPETTGYIIPTLLDWSQTLHRADLHACALEASDWLMTQQLPGGLWCSGAAGGQQPSVFNTAMILWGLAARCKTDTDGKTWQSLTRAADALVACQDADGAWRQYTYRSGYVPAYYAYACAAIDTAARALTHDALQEAAHKQLRWLFQQPGLLADPARMGFAAQTPAFSHTVGYTLQGLGYWSAYDEAAREALSALANRLADDFHTFGRLPGAYGSKPQTSFSCLTGDFQIGWALMTYFPKHAKTGLHIGQQAAATQRQDGGFWGSWPAHGPYMRWRQPNWAAKYFLDWANQAQQPG